MPCASPRRPDVYRVVFALFVAAAILSSLTAAEVAAAELPAVAPASLIQWG
ncbi:MAG: hypothetical protein ACT4PE_10390 [Candidatus Eiseniibacteriota bacterium]